MDLAQAQQPAQTAQQPTQAAPAQNKQKNPTTAALFCFFLGFFGAHNFYLKESGLGIVHIIITVIQFIVGMFASMAAFMLGFIDMTTYSAARTHPAVPGEYIAVFITFLCFFAAHALWILIDFIVILVQGQAGVDRRVAKNTLPIEKVAQEGEPILK